MEQNQSAHLTQPLVEKKDSFEKGKNFLGTEKFTKLLQKHLREEKGKSKKKLHHQQRLALYSNIKDRVIDSVFEAQTFIRSYRAKLLREEQNKVQQQYARISQFCRPRVNQMIQNKRENAEVKENFNLIKQDFSDMEKFLEYQSSRNILDRVERKEMQLLSSSEPLNLNQSTNLSFQYPQPVSQKYQFPFDSYQPSYKDTDLQQLIIEEDSDNIDIGIQNSKQSVTCFTQQGDLFALAMSNGVLRVRDIIKQKIYEINYHLHHHNGNYSSRGRDITCLQIVQDQQLLVCGHENGAMSMYNYMENKILFFMKNFFKYNSDILEQATINKSSLSILDMKVMPQNQEEKDFFLIVSNARGDCILSKISKGILSYEADVEYLVKHELFPITQITLLDSLFYDKYFKINQNNSEEQEEKPMRHIVSLTSPEKLFIVQLKLQKMKAKLLFRHLEKQDSLIHNSKCSFVWGETKLYSTQENQLVFLVSFSNHLYTGIMSRYEEEKEKDFGRIKIQTKFNFELKKRFKHYTSILFIGSLYNHLFLICDYNQTFFLINARDLRLSFSRYISLSYLQPYKISMPTLQMKPSTFHLDNFQLKAQRMVKIISQSQDHTETKLEDLHKANSSLERENAEEAEIHLALKNRLFYTNSASFSISNSVCYILTQKDGQNSQFVKLSLQSWRNTLEELLKQGDYLNAMHFLHSLYHGLHKFSHSKIPKFSLQELLVPQIERVALNYIDEVFLLIRDERENNQQMLQISSDSSSSTCATSSGLIEYNKRASKKPFCDVNFLEDHDKVIFAIEFLEQCNQPDIIFNEVRRICFKAVKSTDFFVECLEPFILEGKISQLPNDALTEIIDYYQQRGNLRIIQQVLTSLDLENVDTKPLIFLSMEKQLITALIYLSTKQKRPDFITPLLIFWNQFVKSIRLWEEKLHGKSRSFMKSEEEEIARTNSTRTTTVEILQRGMGMSSEEDMFLSEQIMLQRVPDFLRIRTEYEGLRALWYFRLCMQQRLIDGEYIIEDHFQEVIKSFDEWISFEQNIKVCLHRWPNVFFNVLRTFFQEKPLKILNKDQKKSKIYSQSYEAESMKQVTSEFCFNKSNVPPSEYLLRLIIKCFLDVDSRFEVQSRSSIERKVERQDTSSANQIQEMDYFEEENEEESEDLSTYKHFVDKNISSNSFNTLLRLRRDSLLSSAYLFFAHLIYESQCSDESSYMVGLFSFRSSKVEQIVFYLAANPKSLDDLDFSQEQLTKNAAIYCGNDLSCDYLELSQLMKSEFMLKLIKNIYPNLKPPNKRNELSLLLDSTEFITARSHVLLLREQYYRAVDSYLQSTNKLMRRLVFSWMDSNLQQSQAEDEQKFLILKEIMKKKLPDLIRIDSELTHLIFQKYLNDAEQDIISKLSNNSHLQLLYITNVIKSYKQAINLDPTAADKLKVDNSVLILHIQLMCNLNKPEEEILNEITTLDFYPLKEILIICQEKQYLEICSYLHLRMSSPDLAIRSRIKIFENTLKSYRKYLEDFCSKIDQFSNDNFLKSFFVSDEKNRNQSSQHRGSVMMSMMDNNENNSEEKLFMRSGTNMAFSALTSSFKTDSQSSSQNLTEGAGGKVAKFNSLIDENLKKMWDICARNKSYEKSGENWFLLLDLLIEIGKKNEDMENNQQLSQMKRKYSQVIGDTIMEIGNQIEMEDLLRKLSESETNINVAELKETFTKLLKNSIESVNFILQNHTFIQGELLKVSQIAQDSFLRGQSSQSKCFACFESLHSLDTIRKKIRKHVISQSEVARSFSQVKFELQPGETEFPLGTSGSFEEQEEDQEGPSIIVFFCGHSYHKECCFKQKSQCICTECLRIKNQLIFLMIQKRDLNISQLTKFMKLQQQMIEEKVINSCNPFDSEQSSRSTSEEQQSRQMSGSFSKEKEESNIEDKKEIKKFIEVKRLNKLKNFDKQQYSKYANLEILSSSDINKD